jgi:hypothetical protein
LYLNCNPYNRCEFPLTGVKYSSRQNGKDK